MASRADQDRAKLTQSASVSVLLQLLSLWLCSWFASSSIVVFDFVMSAARTGNG